MEAFLSTFNIIIIIIIIIIINISSCRSSSAMFNKHMHIHQPK